MLFTAACSRYFHRTHPIVQRLKQGKLITGVRMGEVKSSPIVMVLIKVLIFNPWRLLQKKRQRFFYVAVKRRLIGHIATAVIAAHDVLLFRLVEFFPNAGYVRPYTKLICDASYRELPVSSV